MTDPEKLLAGVRGRIKSIEVRQASLDIEISELQGERDELERDWMLFVALEKELDRQMREAN